MNLLARVLGSLEARLNQPWLSIWRTLYFNFRTMPFKVAIKLPVFIYGRVRFFMLNGSVIFEKTKIKSSPYVEEQVQYLFNNKNSVFYVAHEEIQDIPENIQIEM